MGIERSVTRWYLQRLIYENEAASFKTKLNEMRNAKQELENKERAEFEKQATDVLARMYALGPCPKAMMG